MATRLPNGKGAFSLPLPTKVVDCVAQYLNQKNASITAIGGGDMRFTTVGIPVPSDKTENRECGWGKVIISPSDKAKTHKFKVQMEILDNEI